MRFTMKSDPGKPMTLVCTWWGDNSGNRRFDILAESEKIATVNLDRPAPGRFIDQPFPVPAALTSNQEKITIELRAHPGNIAGGLFGARLARSQ